MSLEDVVDELTYCSYWFQRQRTPEVAPERWAKVYANAAALEARYQREQQTEEL